MERHEKPALRGTKAPARCIQPQKAPGRSPSRANWKGRSPGPLPQGGVRTPSKSVGRGREGEAEGEDPEGRSPALGACVRMSGPAAREEQTPAPACERGNSECAAVLAPRVPSGLSGDRCHWAPRSLPGPSHWKGLVSGSPATPTTLPSAQGHGKRDPRLSGPAAGASAPSGRCPGHARGEGGRKGRSPYFSPFPASASGSAGRER